MKENKRNKNKNIAIQQNRARSELLAGTDTNTNISKLSNGSTNLINYADFHIKQKDLDERMAKLYKVRQEIHLEFTETEKYMKHMKEVMEGGSDALITNEDSGM